MHNDELAHYGVKGMKWGVRKDPDRVTRRQVEVARRKSVRDGKQARLMSGRIAAYGKNDKRLAKYDRLHERHMESKKDYEDLKSKRKLQKAQAKYDQKVNRNWTKAYNKAADHANNVLIPEINAKYEKKYGKNWYAKASENNSKEYQRYLEEYHDLFNKTYEQAVIDTFGERPK